LSEGEDVKAAEILRTQAMPSCGDAEGGGALAVEVDGARFGEAFRRFEARSGAEVFEGVGVKAEAGVFDLEFEGGLGRKGACESEEEKGHPHGGILTRIEAEVNRLFGARLLGRDAAEETQKHSDRIQWRAGKDS